jgi:hypothetical protein
MTIYPEESEALYYIELNTEENEVTLYRRHFFMPHEQFEKLQDEFGFRFLSNEGHPYQIFRQPVPPPGCVPDVSWYKWMVNRLNLCA